MSVLCNVMKFHTEVCSFYSSDFPSYCEVKQRYQLPPENYFVYAYPTLWSCWTHDWWLWQAGIAKSQLGKHTKNRILSLRVYVCMYVWCIYPGEKLKKVVHLFPPSPLVRPQWYALFTQRKKNGAGACRGLAAGERVTMTTLWEGGMLPGATDGDVRPV